jgi:glyoxylase-like metal-dependent hydrolase (beta-lactamase superfamily II)
MTQIQTFTFSPFQENTYLLWDETNEAVIIDPGCLAQREK